MTKNKKIIFIGIIFLAIPFFANADTLGQEVIFNIDSSYDLQGRKETTAILEKVTNQIYFYVDKEWWQKLDDSKKQSLDVEIYNLGVEFEKNIYPKLTSTFGSEPKPGIDKDERITILLHPMIKEAGGYFNSGDVYSRFQVPGSNEREMVYLNSQYIDWPEAKSFLAHEFTHLITTNQKNLLKKVTEEIWLNEARTEYSATLLGYNDVYQGSDLERRVKNFLSQPSTSLTEWLNKKENYGAVNLFTHYLVDHYGLKILIDSLQSNKVGIESLNYALAKNNYDKNFSDIFTDWIITLLVNDCNLGEKFCYLNEHLRNFRLTPTLYFLPKTETILSTYHRTTYWQPNWQRFVGGGKNLTLEFEGTELRQFKIPYLLCDLKKQCQIDFLALDKEQKGKLVINGFNSKYSSLTIMPFINDKTSGFNGEEDSFSFSWKVTVTEAELEKKEESEVINRLLAKIEELKRQIAQYQAEIEAIRGRGPISCQRFDNNLYYGLTNNPEVRCLQEFLKAQGPEIYPEGLVTGNFLSLTQKAVIRFQEKHATEILAPWGLEKGTGFVGQTTRAKINALLSK